MDKGFCQSRGFYQPSSERVQEIRDNYELKLPGKFLFQILIRFLNSRDRDLNVTERDLYNLALAIPNLHLPLNDLIKKIEQRFDTIEQKLDTKEREAALRRRPEVKKGDKVSAIILKKENIKGAVQSQKFTVQLQTGKEEELTFQDRYYHGKVGYAVKLTVIEIDDTGRVRKVAL